MSQKYEKDIADFKKHSSEDWARIKELEQSI